MINRLSNNEPLESDNNAQATPQQPLPYERKALLE